MHVHAGMGYNMYRYAHTEYKRGQIYGVSCLKNRLEYFFIVNIVCLFHDKYQAKIVNSVWIVFIEQLLWK